MKKYNLMATLSLLVFVTACGGSSGGGSDSSTSTTTQGYVPPTYGPPSLDWYAFYPGFNPPGNCGSTTTLPTNCYGSNGGYLYCNNEWLYQWNNTYWVFPAFGACGATGSLDQSYGYDSGWLTYWNLMNTSESAYTTITAPHTGYYYVSFMGTYTGAPNATLSINLNGVGTASVKNLDTSGSFGQQQLSCWVTTKFLLTGGSDYQLYLSGSQGSVDYTQLRVTDYPPTDTSTTCN